MNLTMHKRAIHDIDVIWYSCEFCNYKTKHARNLQSHIQSKHKSPKKRKKTPLDRFIIDVNDRYLSNDGIWHYGWNEDQDPSNN